MERNPKGSDAVLSVGALTVLIKDSLETAFPSVAVEGEVSNAKLASSGHLYFSLKDRDAVIQAVMFKFRLGTLDFDIADGMKIVARGAVSVYSARGQYQLIVNSARRAGLGDILAMIEERKRTLQAEGLFDPDRKRNLPRVPSRIAVVTSPTGAAIHDILTVLRRRNSGIKVIILPTAVQGEGAGDMIAARIRQANRMKLADVLIVGRGGGSLEDLLAFSDEAVVRAIASSEIPVISAVGHEVDWSLSDFAADVRAPTPSAAAELVAESRETLSREVEQFHDSLESAMRARLEYARLALETFTPGDVETRFMRIYLPIARRFDEARDELAAFCARRLREAGHRLELAGTALALASPQAILQRCYSIVRKADHPDMSAGKGQEGLQGAGPAIRNASELQKGEAVHIMFSTGSAIAEVGEVRP
jgi:exodeoxyribonuclease VII large subunit